MVRSVSAADALGAAYSGRRVCVTGGAGFIGSHLVERLLRLGAAVTVIDDLSNSSGIALAELVERHPARLRFVFGSILDARALRDAVASAHTLFHLAAMNSVPRSFDEPGRVFEVNAIGTVRVAEAARKGGVSRLIYAASSSAYGDDPALPKVETMLPKPMSPYGASKLAGETVVSAWARGYGLPAMSLRLFNVFGPRQAAGDAYAAVVAAFATRLLAGKPPIIFGNGSASRDFTPVAAVVEAFLLAGAAGTDPRGAVANIGCGRRTTVLDLARTLARLVGRPDLEPEFHEPRRGDVPHSLADISLARDLIGYEPPASIDDALEQTLAWYREGTTAGGAAVPSSVTP